MDDYSVYNSPFTSSIFKTSKPQTIREVYRERIKQIYYSQFPSLLNSDTQKLIDSPYIKEENKPDITEEKDKEEIPNSEQKTDEISIQKTDEKPTQNSPLKKLTHALKLLDIEYFGREQKLYESLFNKYMSDTPLPEYLPHSYSTPLISEILLTENECTECSECLQSYPLSEFPQSELSNNGYYLACMRCAPDRNTVIALKWHSIYKSDSVLLENNGFIAKVIASNHRYCIANQTPVTKGIHCWRWCTQQYQSWFLWGISHCKKYTHNSYGNQGVYGIAGSNQSYKNGQCSYDIQTGIFFGGKTKVLIDMCLDCSKGELRFVVPGNDTEAKMVNIPTKDANGKGWVPHCNMHYANATVQIKKIPQTWYGKMPKRVKFN